MPQNANMPFITEDPIVSGILIGILGVIFYAIGTYVGYLCGILIQIVAP